MTNREAGLIRSEGTILAIGVFGALRIDQPYDDTLLDFYSGVYGRESEIKDMPSPTRHLAFECVMDNGYKILFTGCEVDKMSDIPGGMHGFEVASDTLRVFIEDARRPPVIEANIEWDWKHTFLAFGDAFTAGDFTAKDPVFHIRMENVTRGPFFFYFAENTFGNYGSGDYREDDVLLAEPAPSWRRRYEELRDWLLTTLPPDVILGIEHYGSTAIPGIPAKPVIDILAEVPSFRTVRKEIVPRLCSGDCSYSFYMNHAVFIKRTHFEGNRIAHIHMAPKGHEVWKGIAFRDCLRSNPELAREYAELKRSLASSYRNDRNRYTMGKEAFIGKIASITK